MNKIAFVLTGARAPLARMSWTALFLAVLGSAVLLGSGCSKDGDGKGSINYPVPPPPQSRNWLFDVYGTGPNDVYACGNKGVMFHFTGGDWSDSTQWMPMDMGVSTPIVKLWENQGTMYAVGHGGRIWRNTSGQWSSMDSGVTKNLYGIGMYDDAIYACGAEGTLRRLNGGSWVSTPTRIVIRDPGTGEPDTLNIMDRTTDLSSILAVNQYFIGGAFKTPDYDENSVGIMDTDGMVMTWDSQPDLYDWNLIPLRGDQLADAEWVLCMTGNPLVPSQNYLGTSEGWLFQLERSESGKLVWVKHFPRVTVDPGSGIRDIWVDEDENVFVVTDDGQLMVQSPDYDYSADTGSRTLLYDQTNALVGIWGSGRDNFYMVGFVENSLYHCAMVDVPDTNIAEVTRINIPFGDKGLGSGLDPFTDEIGRPRF